MQRHGRIDAALDPVEPVAPEGAAEAQQPQQNVIYGDIGGMIRLRDTP